MEPNDSTQQAIRFAAKLGFLSKKSWEDFFGTKDRSWRYRKFQSLLEKKIFIAHPSRIAKNIYVLNSKNKFVKSLVGTEVSAPPYVAQLDHDEKLSRILILLSRSGVIEDFTCESEIKRLRHDEKPWQSDADKLKFPDAILYIKNKNESTAIALEIELTAKSQKRYRKIFDIYQDTKNIKAVLFAINSTTVFKALKKAIDDTQYPDWKKPIGFMKVEDCLVDPGRARIIFREQNLLFCELVNLKTIED